jgi:hypothetical protein
MATKITGALMVVWFAVLSIALLWTEKETVRLN